jgi:hypothetical protein
MACHKLLLIPGLTRTMMKCRSKKRAAAQWMRLMDCPVKPGNDSTPLLRQANANNEA